MPLGMLTCIKVVFLPSELIVRTEQMMTSCSFSSILEITIG